MIEIFAHRAIYENKENSLDGIVYNLKLGFNIEIDVRIKSDKFYLSHEPQEGEDSFYDACKIIKQNSKRAAIHIKENFDIKNIIDLIYKQNIEKDCFIFSTLENYDNIKKYKNINFANYQNKFQNNPIAKILWCDESNEIWYDEKIFSEYKKNE